MKLGQIFPNLISNDIVTLAGAETPKHEEKQSNNNNDFPKF